MDRDELQRRLNNLRPSEALPVGETPEEEYSECETVPDPEPIPIPEFQPENDYPAGDVKQFRPSKYQRPDAYDASYIAIPAPRWPDPAAPMTPEVWQAYHAELMLCIEANGRLREYCYWLTHEKGHLAALPLGKESDGLRERADRSLLIDAQYRATGHLEWLTGLWSARHIPIPSIEELEELAATRAQTVSQWQ